MKKYLLSFVFLICCVILVAYSGLDALFVVLTFTLKPGLILLIPCWLIAFILIWKHSGITEAWNELNPVTMFTEIIHEET